jgi:3',5'-cyclic AMP phosphodiesterase CpdA
MGKIRSRIGESGLMNDKIYSSAIILLSDMEFGYLHRSQVNNTKGHIATVEALIQDLQKVLKPYKFHGNDLGLIITGDIASFGKEEEYKLAEEAIDKLIEHLKIPKEHIAIIPGNHDVNWKSCREAYLKRYGREKKALTDNNKRIRACGLPQKLISFQKLLKTISTPDIKRYHSKSIYLFPDFDSLGIALVGFDTTYPCTFYQKDNHGSLEADIIHFGSKKLKRIISRKRRLLPIALLHHSTYPTADSIGTNKSYLYESDTVRDTLNINGFSVVICGHEHRASAYYCDMNTGQHTFTMGTFGANNKQLVNVYGKNHKETNRYGILFIQPEGKSCLKVRKLSPPASPKGVWDEDREKSEDSIVLKRSQLPSVDFEKYKKRIEFRLGKPKKLPDGKTLLSICLDCGPNIRNIISSITYKVDEKEVMAQIREYYFMADLIINPLKDCSIHVHIIDSNGEHSLDHDIPIPANNQLN